MPGWAGEGRFFQPCSEPKISRRRANQARPPGEHRDIGRVQPQSFWRWLFSSDAVQPPMRFTWLLLLNFAALADSSAAGVWRGESLCTKAASAACRNETVVYSIRGIAHHPDALLIRADKVVDGKAVTMGTGEWEYDAARQSIEWHMPQQVWLLRLHGDRIHGTLTLADGTVIRDMSLKKDD